MPDGDPAKLITATATLTALVGAMLVLARVARLGFVADFISTPVLTGFKAGIGLVIVLDQIPKLLGTHITKQGFFPDLLSVAQHVPETSLLTLAVAVATLVVLVGMDRALAALAGAAGGGGPRHRGVVVLRPRRRSASRPSARFPRGCRRSRCPTSRSSCSSRPAAAGMALMSFTESIASARAFAHPGDPPVDANRELVAVGAGNLAGALFGAMPAGGGTSQTAVVAAAGGRSQRTSLVTAGAALATMLLLAPLLGLLPNATLAMVVIVYSVGLIQPAEFRAIRQVRTMEFRWAVAAMLGVLLFGTLQGIVVAIIVSLIGLSSQAARPTVHVIGRKRGADVLRPVSPEYPGRRDLRGPADPASRGAPLLRQRAERRRADPGAGREAPAAGGGARPEPGAGHRVLGAAGADRGREADHGTRHDRLAGGLNPPCSRWCAVPASTERLGRERMLFNARLVIERYQAMLAREAAAARIEGVT